MMSIQLQLLWQDKKMLKGSKCGWWHEGWVIHCTLRTNFDLVFLLVKSHKPGHQLCNVGVHMEMRHEEWLHLSVWHIDNVNIFRDEFSSFLKFIYKFCGFLAPEISSWPLVFSLWCLAGLKEYMPLEISCMTLYFIVMHTLNHGNGVL